MKPYMISTPTIIKWGLQHWVWNKSRSKKSIYLTFDDGPTQGVTNWVLEQLESFNAKATFFCIGKNMKALPDLSKRLMTSDHTLGNHTFNHEKGWKTPTEDYLESIAKTQQFLNENRKYSPDINMYFRPPYGQIRLNQARKLRQKGYKIVMWDVLSGDFDKKLSPENCMKNVTHNVKNGSIIVFHDSIKAEKKLRYVLPKILDYYTREGFQFKALPQRV